MLAEHLTAAFGTNYHVNTQIEMFEHLKGDEPKPPMRAPVEVGAPLWTADKALLIDEYIHLFLLVTKHGVYLDLFAGPQSGSGDEYWAVRRVLERRTGGGPSIRHYAVCDSDPKQTARLRDLGRHHPSFKVYEGDANELVHSMLDHGQIGAKTACFCLLDQRTFECSWSTVEAVANFKNEGYKIELFYFLAQGWIDRAWASIRDKSKLAAWWGRQDHERFRKLASYDRAATLCQRFREELGYGYARPFAIYEKGSHSKTMYYMIHASDHPAAINLMSRAYRNVKSGSREGVSEWIPGFQPAAIP